MTNSNKIKIDKYKDEQGLTEKKMNFGLWFVRNRKLFLGILVVVLLLVSIITWLNSIYNFSYYFFRGKAEDENVVREAIKNQVPQAESRLVLKDIQKGSVSVLRVNDKVNFVVKIDNLNIDHWAYFKYSMLIDGQETEEINGFVLPGESKYLVQIGQSITGVNKNASLVLKDVLWHRVQKHKIEDWRAFSKLRLNMEVFDKEFLPAKSSGLSEKIMLSLLRYKVKNNSPFNYWDINFNIILYSRSNIIAVNRHAINEFLSGETREVSVIIPGDINRVTEIKVVPEIDLTRSDIYMQF